MKRNWLLIALIALLVTGVATQAGSFALHVSVHDGHRGASEILTGDLVVGERQTRTALRIEQSVTGDSIKTAELYNNLCIARIKRNNLSKARKTCTRAVSHAMRLVAGIGQNPQSIKRVKSAALSNRGVVNMLDGDLDGALTHFVRASELAPSLETVELNLAAATAASADSGIAVVLD